MNLELKELRGHPFPFPIFKPVLVLFMHLYVLQISWLSFSYSMVIMLFAHAVFFSLGFSKLCLPFHSYLFNSSLVLRSQLNDYFLKEALPDAAFFPPPNLIKYLFYIHFHSSLYFSFITLNDSVYLYSCTIRMLSVFTIWQ